CTLTVNGNQTATATFQPAEYLLNVNVAGSGAGTVTSSPPGISCGSDCSQTYTEGTTVTLTAVPSSGSVFTGWSGPCSGQGTCTLTVNGNQTATATFQPAVLDARDDVGYEIGPPDNPSISLTQWYIPVTDNDVNPTGSLLTILDFTCLEGCYYLDDSWYDTDPAPSPRVHFRVGESGIGKQLVRWSYAVADDQGGYDEAFVEVTLDWTAEFG
ncbi:MAG: hypothetical protein ACE5E8_06720, partial [Acidimicrobiia bacterium]